MRAGKIELRNGKVYVDAVETNDAELIGYSLLDFAETYQSDDALIIAPGFEVENESML